MSEPDARKRLIDYLIAQSTADLAAVSWGPVLLCAAVLALARTHWMTLQLFTVASALIGVLMMPVFVVLLRRRQLMARDVPQAVIDAHVARRRGRQGSWMQRSRALVARFETVVSTPLLFLVVGAALVRTLLTANLITFLLALSLARAAVFLYTGPSRRGLPQPPEIGG